MTSPWTGFCLGEGLDYEKLGHITLWNLLSLTRFLNQQELHDSSFQNHEFGICSVSL